MGCNTGSASTHLLVEDRAENPAAHHKVQNFAAVKTGVQHADADSHHGIGFFFELPDQRTRIGHIGSDDSGIIAFEFRVQIIQILSESRSVMLGDGKYDGFTGTDILTGSQFLIAFPGQPVKFFHHQAVCFFVCPLPFELGRVIMFFIDIRAPGNDLGNSGSEFIRRQVVGGKSILYPVGKIRLARFAVIKFIGIVVDIAGRGGGQPDVQRVEVGQRRLPGAVNGTMTFIHNHNIEIPAGIILAAADHGLEQRHGDLFFLPHHAGSQPVAAVLTAEQILNGFQHLFGKLFAIDQK